MSDRTSNLVADAPCKQVKYCEAPYLRKEIGRRTAELEQQCLLLGKSGSREAALLAERDRLRALLVEARSHIYQGRGWSVDHGDDCQAHIDAPPSGVGKCTCGLVAWFQSVDREALRGADEGESLKDQG